MRAVRVHEGGELRYEEAPDPVAGPGEVVVELRAAAVNRRDLLVRNPPGPGVRVRPAADSGLGRRRRAARHRRGGRDLCRARLGAARGRGRARLEDPRWARRRYVRRAREGAGGERLPQAGALLVGGGGGVSAGGADRLPGTLRDRRAGRRRERARPRRRQRCVDDGRVARRPGRVPSAGDVFEPGEDRPRQGARRRGRRPLHRGRLGRGGRAGRRRARLGRLDVARVAEGAAARRPAGRPGRHRRAGGDARRAGALPELAVDPRDDDGLARATSRR